MQKRVDLGTRNTFKPPTIYIYLWSVYPKLVIMVEFTVSWEERTEEFHELKKTKYQYLAYS